jgi:DNA polymerase-1
VLINIDAKQLEWVTAVYLSQDPVGIDEIERGFDQHADNQKRFDLPSRTVAKILLFRTIYGGTGYSFTTDPEFGYLGSESWWDEKIATFYAKYKGLHSWHERLYERVVLDNGRLEMPTGRVYQFERYANRSGETKYPRTKVLNYPVQGLAADLVSIARVSLMKRLSARTWDFELLWVNTVHDSIILDLNTDSWDNILEVSQIIYGVFEDIPKNFKKLFDVEFNLPVRCEITAGYDWKHLYSDIILLPEVREIHL